MSDPTTPLSLPQNYLINAIPSEEREHLIPMLEYVEFSLGQVIYESGCRLDYIYFPTTSVVSLLYTTEDGFTAEMGLTGNDGAIGIASVHARLKPLHDTLHDVTVITGEQTAVCVLQHCAG